MLSLVSGANPAVRAAADGHRKKRARSEAGWRTRQEESFHDAAVTARRLPPSDASTASRSMREKDETSHTKDVKIYILLVQRRAPLAWPPFVCLRGSQLRVWLRSN
jgi:hypothetical protein